VPTSGLEPILDLLGNLGYSSQFQGTIRGISGEDHRFDIVARKDRYRIVIIVIPSSNYNSIETEMVKLRAKAYDCAPDLGIVIFPSEASQKLRDLSDFYRFALIEGTNPRNMEEGLRKALLSIE